MRKLIRFALFGSLAFSSLRAEALNDILARMDQSARNFKTFSAKMKRTEFTKILNDTEVIDGARRLRRTNGQTVGILEFFGKNPQTIRLSGKTAEVYYPEAKRDEIWDSSKLGKMGKQVDQLLLLGIGVSSADLRRDYDVTAGATTEMIAGKKTTRLVLIPKDSDLRKQAEKIELWIPEGDSVPVQVKVTRTSGDYDLAVYSDIQMNPPLPDSAFELNLPADVKRVKVK